jgi:KAP family P-loop domain
MFAVPSIDSLWDSSSKRNKRIDAMPGFKLLLDSPAESPVLGFGQFAHAFKEIVEESDPRFAIGIFGGWGSGKTTLMESVKKAIDDDLVTRDKMVTVWFNAWRYEKEEHLIVPLLDTLRDELVTWAEERPVTPDVKSRAIKAASTAARAAQAILAGITIKAKVPGLPGSPEVAFEGGKLLAELRHPDNADDEQMAKTPQSLYHASFQAMQRAFHRFAGDATADRRIVVFVDDLDRCLPPNALQVLESMKLFFDIPGFIFLVALDRDVVERAIEVKYEERRAAEDRTPTPTIRGSEYIKKIFQVPFTLPPISPQQIGEFLDFVTGMSLPPEQIDDLRKRVQPHLADVVSSAGVNPREIKRYINAYVLQRKLRPHLDANVILTLQTINFRSDWKSAYGVLVSEPAAFTDAVNREIAGEEGAMIELWPDLRDVSSTLLAYLSKPAAKSFLNAPLDLYIYSLESTQSVDTWLVDVYGRLGRLQQLLRTAIVPDSPKQARESAGADFRQELNGMQSVLASALSGPRGNAILEEIAGIAEVSAAPDPGDWDGALGNRVAALRRSLLGLREAVSVGPRA